MNRILPFLLLFCAGCLGPRQVHVHSLSDQEINTFIKSSDRVEIMFTLEMVDAPARSTVLTNADDVSSVLTLVELATKDPCMCAHSKSIRFYKAKRFIECNFCDHCFDVLDYPDIRLYKMPQRLLERLTALDNENKKRMPNQVSDATSETAPDAASSSHQD